VNHPTLLFAAVLVFASSAVAAHEPGGKKDRRDKGDRDEPAYREHVVPYRHYGDSYWDFRIGWGGEPLLNEAEYDYNDGGPVDEIDWDAPGGSLEFNAAHRFGARGPASGYVIFGGFLRGFEGEDDPNTGDEVELGILGVQIGGGFSFRPNARYSLEIGPRLGVGSAGATERIGGDELESDGGGYARIDFGAANLFNFNKVQFGVTIGVASWSATVPYDGQTVNGTFYAPADVTYSGSGGYLNLSIGFR
jgi:hypothetical protein